MAYSKTETLVTGIDMTSATYLGTEVRLISRALRRLGLKPRQLLYRGFDGNKLDVMLKHGTDILDHDSTFAVPFKGLMHDGDIDENPLMYTSLFNRMALACYDLNQMAHGDAEYDYAFKNPQSKQEALIAVLKLYYPTSDRNW